MSIRDIIQHSVNKNPLGMKESLEEEMRNRVAAAIQAKMESADVDAEELEEMNSDEDTVDEGYGKKKAKMESDDEDDSDEDGEDDDDDEDDDEDED